MSDKNGAEVLEAYREAFRPSSLMDKPRSIVAIGVICAETSEEALRLAKQVAKPDHGFKAAVQSSSDAGSQPKKADDDSNNRSEAREELESDGDNRLLVGTPEQVWDKLKRMAAQYSCDEFLIFSPINDYKKRLESYRLLAKGHV
ncbi:LLM class flavin-dependent oxidoreductase [Paenibacillus faecalis]|uniref:LLM class flavin-dependent oxidoreductase n=1 Tax=Paenibacillus faecalis TaxID=2079532 RepID=UPI003077D831